MRIKKIFLLLFAACIAIVSAKDFVWNGTSGVGKWTTTANWDVNDGTYPMTSVDNVTLNNTSVYPCTLNVTLDTVNNLTVATTYTGTLWLAGDTLVVNGNMTLSGNNSTTKVNCGNKLTFIGASSHFVVNTTVATLTSASTALRFSGQTNAYMQDNKSATWLSCDMPDNTKMDFDAVSNTFTGTPAWTVGNGVTIKLDQGVSLSPTQSGKIYTFGNSSNITTTAPGYGILYLNAGTSCKDTLPSITGDVHYSSYGSIVTPRFVASNDTLWITGSHNWSTSYNYVGLFASGIAKQTIAFSGTDFTSAMIYLYTNDNNNKEVDINFGSGNITVGSFMPKMSYAGTYLNFQTCNFYCSQTYTLDVKHTITHTSDVLHLTNTAAYDFTTANKLMYDIQHTGTGKTTQVGNLYANDVTISAGKWLFPAAGSLDSCRDFSYTSNDSITMSIARLKVGRNFTFTGSGVKTYGSKDSIEFCGASATHTVTVGTQRLPIVNLVSSSGSATQASRLYTNVLKDSSGTWNTNGYTAMIDSVLTIGDSIYTAPADSLIDSGGSAIMRATSKANLKGIFAMIGNAAATITGGGSGVAHSFGRTVINKSATVTTSGVTQFDTLKLLGATAFAQTAATDTVYCNVFIDSSSGIKTFTAPLVAAKVIKFDGTGAVTVSASIIGTGASDTVRFSSGLGTVDLTSCNLYINGATAPILHVNRQIAVTSLNIGAGNVTEVGSAAVYVWGSAAPLVMAGSDSLHLNGSNSFYDVLSGTGNFTSLGANAGIDGTESMYFKIAHSSITASQPALTIGGSGTVYYRDNAAYTAYVFQFTGAQVYPVKCYIQISNATSQGTFNFNNQNFTCRTLWIGGATLTTGTFAVNFGSGTIHIGSFRGDDNTTAMNFQTSQWTVDSSMIYSPSLVIDPGTTARITMSGLAGDSLAIGGNTSTLPKTVFAAAKQFYITGGGTISALSFGLDDKVTLQAAKKLTVTTFTMGGATGHLDTIISSTAGQDTISTATNTALSYTAFQNQYSVNTLYDTVGGFNLGGNTNIYFVGGFALSVSSQHDTVGKAIVAITASTTSGTADSFTVSPAISNGTLAMSHSTGTWTGTPSTQQAATAYTVSAWEKGSAVKTATVTITVYCNGGPYSYGPRITWYIGTAITPRTVTNGNATCGIDSAIAPTYPGGISLARGTGTATGTPTTQLSLAYYKVFFYNMSGGVVYKDSATDTITVNPALPAFSYVGSPFITDTTYVAALHSPTSTGGPITSFSTSGTLPLGYTLNTSTGVVGGTGTLAKAATVYPIVGTNASGSTTANISITVHGGATCTILPISGLTSGGTALRLYWPGGMTASGTSGTIGGTSIVSWNRISADSASGISPAGSSGTRTVSLTNSIGDIATTTFIYYSNAKPMKWLNMYRWPICAKNIYKNGTYK